MSAETAPTFIQDAPNPVVHEGFRHKVAETWHKLGRLATVGMLAAGAAIGTFAAEEAADPTPAYADAAAKVTIGMPFNGKWAYNTLTGAACGDDASETSHPSCHNSYGFDWATDLYAGPNTDVRVYGSSPQGTITFKRSSTSDTCGAGVGGSGVTFDVFSGSNKVGQVKYDHLDLVDVGSGAISSGTKIGNITSETARTSCFQVSHSHLQLKNTEGKYACYVNHSTSSHTAGISLSQGDSLGFLGSSNTGPKQACSTSEMSGSQQGGSRTLSRPAAIVFNGALNVFARGNDGQIYNQYWNGTKWTGFASIGGNMNSDPATIVNGNALNVFATGADGQVYTKYNAGNGWSAWASLGATRVKGNPRVAKYNGELDVVALGTDGHPYKNTWQADKGWGGWSSLGNYMDSSPTILQYGSELDVIMRGGDNAVYKDTWNGNSWGGFAFLGARVAGNPDAISYGGQLDVWANSSSNRLWKRTWNGRGWGNWTDMGGNFAGDPDVMQYNSDLEVFVRGTDNHIYTRYWSANGQYWSAWSSLGGSIAGEPTAVQYGSELSVFATGTDGKVYKNTFFPSSGWGGFSVLPG